MARSLVALTALLTLSPVPAAAGEVTLRWHGQSFFEIVSPRGVRVVLDPHAIEAFGRKEVPADLVLMSHFHDDHTRTEVIPNLKSAKQIHALTREDREGRRVGWNALDETVRDVRVQTVGTYHDNAGGLERGKNGVFVLEIDGLRIVHLGDLGHLLSREQVRRIGVVDVLLIPVGGVYTLNGLDAQKVVEQLKPRHSILPMHYGTAVYTDLLGLNYFLDDQTMGAVKKYATNTLFFDTKAPPPKEPVVAVLHWERGR